MIEIALKDTDKTPTWMLPGTRLFLSFEAPGPISIDMDSLSLEQKKVIAQDVARGILVGKNTEELLNSSLLAPSTPTVGGGALSAKSYAAPRLVKIYQEPEEGQFLGIQVAPKASPVEIQEGFKEDPYAERREFFKNELEKHVATVKKELPGRSLSELRIMRDIEFHEKNRPSVIKLIDTLISRAQAEVFHSLQKSYDPKAGKPAPSDLPKQYLDNVTPVVESPYRDITIKLGADDE